MAEKILIEIYKNKSPDELTRLLADPESRLETGSGAAVTASVAAALLCRTAALAKAAGAEGERLEYIVRNSEILRNYMIHLIDEDVQCRGPLRRAMKEGGAREIEAARRPAVAICEEIINMMDQCLEMLEELCGLCPPEALSYAASGAELAVGSAKAAMRYVLAMAAKSDDETYRFVTRRENEITLARLEQLCGQVTGKTGP